MFESSIDSGFKLSENAIVSSIWNFIFQSLSCLPSVFLQKENELGIQILMWLK
jgi:hypothetical protein